MLLELEIKDFALIDHVTLSLDTGFTILSGETGAGKSILIDAVSMCLGSRADREMVRSGQDKALIQAVFLCPDTPQILEALERAGIEVDETRQLIVSRDIHATGRSVCRINGITVTQQLLKETMRMITDLHGQHEHQSLLRHETHVDLLDTVGGSELQQVKEEYRHSYHRLVQLKQELTNLGSSEGERARKRDFLAYQIHEIETAALSTEEEETLNEQNELLRNAQQIIAVLGGFHEEVYEGSIDTPLLDQLGRHVKGLWDVSRHSRSLEQFASQAESLLVQFQDLSREIRDYQEQMDFDPKEVERIQERLDEIHEMKRKYGPTVEDVLAYLEEVKQKEQQLLNSAERYRQVSDELKQEIKKAHNLAGSLSQSREAAARRLENEMVQVLKELNMGNVVFSVDNQVSVSPDEAALEMDVLDENGIDRISFMISTNPGEPVKPLSKIASGGEMSRIMLAFKTIFARMDAVPTLIFDEIDSGISGRTAQVVGEKLRYVAGTHQVICITHLPQIAALADTHFLIEKMVVGQKTRVRVQRLSEKDRINELGRLLDGEMTPITLSHAREMREKAKSNHHDSSSMSTAR